MPMKFRNISYNTRKISLRNSYRHTNTSVSNYTRKVWLLNPSTPYIDTIYQVPETTRVLFWSIKAR